MPTEFTAMTWNLENLFPVGHPSGPESNEVYQLKLTNLEAIVRGIAPDVLAVQEVGAPACFADLHQRLQPDYPHALLSTKPDVRGIRVGFLARWPLADTEELTLFPPGALSAVNDAQGQRINKLGRGALKVSLTLQTGLRIMLITAHLKSKLITYPNGRRSPHDEDERAREMGAALFKRTAEAVALRVFINKLVTNNERPLILMGDFNDGPEAVTTQILLGPEDRSQSRPDKFDDVRLYNLGEYIPAPRRYSRVFRKQPELIDHILVSHELIFRRREVDAFVDPIESIDVSLLARQAAVFPDHAPLYARFLV